MLILMFLLFMIPFIFMNNMYWLVQLNMLIIIFIFTLSGVSNMSWMGLSYFFGYDMMSYGMILLSLWISMLMIMASEVILKNKNFINMFLFMVILLLLLLILTFSSMSLLMFYFFFEGSLIPTLLLILGWGYQPERLQAGMYLMFYTLFASMPLLLMIMLIFSWGGSLFLPLLFKIEVNNYLYMSFMILAFLFKMPMYFVHLWLPKAHVEAPISGSMILAGVLLKLGGYGLLRISPMIMNMMKLSSLIMSISVMGAMLVGFMCLCQSDLKMLIAYSSVVHMGMVLGGVFTMNTWGVVGSYILMIAHGLCSSGMFCLANISYERFGSRSMLVNKGLVNIMPSMSMFWFLIMSSNMSAPPSMNLLGEMFLINSLIGWSSILMPIISVLVFISAAYSLYLYSFTQHGDYNSGLYLSSSGVVREYMLMVLHWFPLNGLIIKSDLFILIL